MKASFLALWRDFQNFFFAPRSLKALGLMRLVVASALFALYSWRQLEIPFFFTDKNGMILNSQSLSLIPEFLRPEWHLFVWADAWVPWVHGFLLFLLLGLVLGVGGRAWTLLTWFLSLSFVQRNYFVAYGVDLIGTMWLFYLSWTRHNAHFSILNYLRPERIKQVRCDLFSSAGARLIQIHLCVIYGFTGLQKLKGVSWWEGTSLWTVFGNRQLTVVDMAWTSQWPFLIAISVFLTLFFEVYFPFLVWRPKIRNKVLLFGLCFHGIIALTMGIWAFGCIMVSSYLLFLDEKELNKLTQGITRHF